MSFGIMGIEKHQNIIQNVLLTDSLFQHFITLQLQNKRSIRVRGFPSFHNVSHSSRSMRILHNDFYPSLTSRIIHYALSPKPFYLSTRTRLLNPFHPTRTFNFLNLHGNSQSQIEIQIKPFDPLKPLSLISQKSNCWVIFTPWQFNIIKNDFFKIIKNTNQTHMNFETLTSLIL